MGYIALAKPYCWCVDVSTHRSVDRRVSSIIIIYNIEFLYSSVLIGLIYVIRFRIFFFATYPITKRTNVFTHARACTGGEQRSEREQYQRPTNTRADRTKTKSLNPMKNHIGFCFCGFCKTTEFVRYLATGSVCVLGAHKVYSTYKLMSKHELTLSPSLSVHLFGLYMRPLARTHMSHHF